MDGVILMAGSVVTEVSSNLVDCGVGVGTAARLVLVAPVVGVVVVSFEGGRNMARTIA